MWLGVQILYVLGVKYYVYVFIQVCVNLQISATWYSYYNVPRFYFWGCDLSPEHAVAHPLHLSLFPPRYMHGSVCVHIEGYGAEYSVLT